MSKDDANPPPSPIVRASDIAAKEQHFSHPWNPKSDVNGVQLARLTGLKRTGVNWIRIPPGKESFIYHCHEREEEWIYILSGRGVAEVDDTDYDVGPGDFLGFPTPSCAHQLRNASDTDDLIYLSGGESLALEIADFPKFGKRMIRRGEKIEIYDSTDAKPFGPLDD